MLEFVAIAILVMAFIQTAPIDLALLFAGDTLMYLEFALIVRIAAGREHFIRKPAMIAWCRCAAGSVGNAAPASEAAFLPGGSSATVAARYLVSFLIRSPRRYGQCCAAAAAAARRHLVLPSRLKRILVDASSPQNMHSRALSIVKYSMRGEGGGGQIVPGRKARTTARRCEKAPVVRLSLIHI